MKIEIPTNCPSCESKLERVKDQLFCRNPNCGEKQIKQVVNYAKVMQIKGLGEQTVKKLGLANIPSIYSLTLSAANAAIGEKLGNKLIHEIQKSKVTTLDKFLAACSIPLIGQTAGSKIASVLNNPFDLSYENCKKAGLGDKATENLLHWFDTEYINNLSTLPIHFEANSTKNNNPILTVCITGRIPGLTKKEITETLSEDNILVVDNISKKVDYLICNERKNSTKERKATELGIEIVTLNELMKEIN